MLMHKENNFAVVIPARIGSTRLPGKLLKKIGDKSIISKVVSSVKDSGFPNIFVATDSVEIADDLKKLDVQTVMTDPLCRTGSDRVFEAIEKVDPMKKFEYILNIQGDMPFIASKDLNDIGLFLVNSNFDIITPVVKINLNDAINTSNVKVVIDKNNKALYFSRHPIPYGSEEFLYHVGIYGFKRGSLNKFVNLEKTSYENCENLEQLRAMQNGMSIGIIEVDQIPISVDTEEDYQKALEHYQNLSI